MKGDTIPCPKCNGTGAIINALWYSQQLRQMRQEKGISTREIARRTGLSAPYICDLELGRRSFNADLIQRYRKALGK